MAGATVVAALTEVIPWLHPRDVATLACTCSALAAAAASVTRLRVSDAARGLEHLPVPIINTVDHLLYPFFAYSPCSLLRVPLSLLPWGTLSHTGRNSFSQLFGRSEEADHCPCFAYNSRTEILEARHDAGELHTDNEADPLPPVCKKSRQQTLQAPLCGRLLEGDIAYDKNSRLCDLSMLGEDPPLHEFLSIMECGPSCRCSRYCRYRVTQQGLSVKVVIYRDRLKGWGLRATQFIAKGSFAFEYAGELLTTVEAQNRQKRYDELRKIDKNFMPSLLVLREHLPSGRVCLRLNIDATQVGNVARFVNHSCDGGNLQPCLTRLSGCFIPKLVFFARRDISDGEELTFSYGSEHNGSKKYQCFCKTASCKGFLPFEET